MSAGNAAAAPAPIGDPTGVADTALRLADLVGHKGLPPLPLLDDKNVELPAMPIGQSQRDLPAGLDQGGLSLSNVEFNGQDLAHPGLPGLSAFPGLSNDQRSLDPSHLAISGVPQLQQLPKLPSLPTAGLPVSVLPDVSTSRSLPNIAYSGFVPTGAVHNLTKVPDLSHPTALTQADGPVELPAAPDVPMPMGDAQRSLPGLGLLSVLPLQGLLAGGLPVGRSLPGTDILGSLPVGLLGGAAAGRSLPGVPALPALPLGLPGVPAGRSLPGLGLLSVLPLQGLLAGGLPIGRSLPGTDVLGALPLGLLGGVAGRELPGVPALPALPLLGGAQRGLPGLGLLSVLPLQGLLAGGLPVGRSLPGLDLLSVLPLQGLLAGGLPVGRSLPGLDLLSVLPLQGLLAGGLPIGRSLPGTDILGSLPVGLLGGAAAGRSLPGVPALPALPLLGGAQRGLPGLDLLSVLPIQGLLAGGLPVGRSLPGTDILGSLPLGGLLGGGAAAGRSLPGLPALPALPALGGGTQRDLPVLGSVLPNLPVSLPGASVSGLHGIPALGPAFTTMPADNSARTIVPGLPNTADVLGGVLGHAPRLPITGV